MRFDLSRQLKTYQGQPFSGASPDGGPLTLKAVLESACLSADPVQYNDGDKKMVIFNLLMKIYQANPFVELSAEEITTLKSLAGKQLSVAAVGAVFSALDKPTADYPAEAADS